jgi:hypothetical protein
MKKFLPFVICLILFPVMVGAQAVNQSQTMLFTNFDNSTDMNSTNTAQLFTTAYNTARSARHGATLTSAQWAKVKAVWLTVENADIRVAFGTNPTQATSTTALGHVISAGNSVRIPDPKKITTMRFISKTLSTPARIQATLEY